MNNFTYERKMKIWSIVMFLSTLFFIVTAFLSMKICFPSIYLLEKECHARIYNLPLFIISLIGIVLSLLLGVICHSKIKARQELIKEFCKEMRKDIKMKRELRDIRRKYGSSDFIENNLAFYKALISFERSRLSLLLNKSEDEK